MEMRSHGVEVGAFSQCLKLRKSVIFMRVKVAYFLRKATRPG